MIMYYGNPFSLKFLHVLQIISVVVVGLTFFSRTAQFIDPDIGWHIATGAWTIAFQEVPDYDLFSFTLPDHLWHNHEWLMDVIFADLFAHGLWGSVIGLFFLFAFIPFTWWIFQTKDLLSLSLVVLAALISLPLIGVRPQIFSFFVFFLLLQLLFSSQLSTPRRIATFTLLPFLFCLWANLHGGFTLGLALWGIMLGTTIGARIFSRKYVWERTTIFELIAFGTSILATLITPYGIGLFTEIVEGAGTSMNQYIGEWQPPFFFWQISLPVFLGCAGVLFLFSWRKLGYPMIATDSFFLIFALLHTRMLLPFFAVVMSGVFLSAESFLLHISGEKDPQQKRAIQYLFATCVGLTVVSLAFMLHSDEALKPSTPAFKAATALRTYCERYPCGNVYNEYNFGGAIIFVSPERKIFTAGYMPHWKNDVGYSPTQDALDLQLDHPERYQDIFEHYDIHIAMVTPALQLSNASVSRSPFILFLERFRFIPGRLENGNLANWLERDGWRCVYADEHTAIYVSPEGPMSSEL